MVYLALTTLADIIFLPLVRRSRKRRDLEEMKMRRDEESSSGPTPADNSLALSRNVFEAQVRPPCLSKISALHARVYSRTFQRRRVRVAVDTAEQRFRSPRVRCPFGGRILRRTWAFSNVGYVGCSPDTTGCVACVLVRGRWMAMVESYRRYRPVDGLETVG